MRNENDDPKILRIILKSQEIENEQLQIENEKMIDIENENKFLINQKEKLQKELSTALCNVENLKITNKLLRNDIENLTA